MHIPFIGIEGDRHWEENSLRHRIGGPALVLSHALYMVYYRKGKPHRMKGPAIIYGNGATEYFQFGKRHRVDGPALQWTDHKEYWQFGELHRIDGPAIQYIDYTEYWKYGKKIR